MARSLGPSGKPDTCMLDCIWSSLDQAFYILDLLCWRGLSVDECSVDFRCACAPGVPGPEHTAHGRA